MGAICNQCKQVLPEVKRKRGSEMRFCPGGKCRTAYHNGLLKKGKALIQKRVEKKPATKKESRFVVLPGMATAERLTALAGAARKLNLTEGPLLKALRRPKAAGAPLTPPQDGNQYEVHSGARH